MTVADRRVRSIRVSLAVVAAFCALSAVGGAGAMLLTDGLGMPLSILDSSPFTSFVIPALVLLFVVGGTQSLALVQLLRHRAPALLCSAVAGFGLVIWIYVETVIIRGFSAHRSCRGRPAARSPATRNPDARSPATRNSAPRNPLYATPLHARRRCNADPTASYVRLTHG
jgi:hypothetical protein